MSEVTKTGTRSRKTPAENLSEQKKPKATANRKSTSARPPVFSCGIRAVRENLGLSLRDVSQAVGFSIAALWQIEHGTDPMLSTAFKLAAFYGCSVEELWKRAQ